jgi:hypothetical protein
VVARWADIALVIPSDSSHDATVDKMFHDLGPSPTAPQLVGAINGLLAENKIQSVAMLVEATGGPLAMAYGPVEVLVDGQQVLDGSNGGVRQQMPITANRLTIRATNLSKAAEPVAPYDLRRGVAPGAGLTLVTIPVASPPPAPGSSTGAAPPASGALPANPTGISPLSGASADGGPAGARPPERAKPKPQPAPRPAPAPPGPADEPEYAPIFDEPEPVAEGPRNGAGASGGSAMAPADGAASAPSRGIFDSVPSLDDEPLPQDFPAQPEPLDPVPVEPEVYPVGASATPGPQAERAEPAVDPAPISVPFRSVLLVEPTAQVEEGSPLPLADVPKTGELSRVELDAGRVEVQGILCQRHHFNNPNASNCMVCGLSMLHLTHNLVKGPRPTLGFIVFDDGSTYGLDRSYLIGREPVAPDDPHTELLILHDNNETLSRTHAELRLVDWSAQLVDLESTNGTYIWDQSFSRWNQLAPGHAVELNSGDTIALGRRTFVFESVSQS